MEIEFWTADGGNLDFPGNRISSTRTGVSRLYESAQIGARLLGYYASFAIPSGAVYGRARQVSGTSRAGVTFSTSNPSEWGRYFRVNVSTREGNTVADTWQYRIPVVRVPLQRDETGGGHKPGQVFKLSTGDYSKRIFMVTRVMNETDILFTPEIEIFGTASTLPLDATDANQFLTVRATPGQTIALPRGKPLSGPWSMPWIEGV